jgi:hypothetical protein
MEVAGANRRGRCGCNPRHESAVAQLATLGIVRAMKTISFILAVVVSGFVVGCSPHEQAVSEAGSISTNGIPAQFAFITTNTTLQEVVDRVGKYDRVRGSGISYYEYDLPDGSAVLVCPDVSLAAKAHPSISVTFYRSTNDIHLYP